MPYQKRSAAYNAGKPRKYYSSIEESKQARKEHQRQWNNQHRELLNEKARQRGKTHRKEANAATQRWLRTHPEKRKIYNQRSRGRRSGVTVTLTAQEWQAICAAYQRKCTYCGKRKPLTQDHVIPFSKGGGTVMGNIVPACQSCNSRKKTGPPLKPVKLVLL